MLAELNADERQWLQLTLAGASNKLAAEDLSVGVRAIEMRRHSLFEKTGVDSVAALVRAVVEADPAAIS